MQTQRKRKLQDRRPRSTSLPSKSPTQSSKPIHDGDPYQTHHRPTPEECRAVRDDLLALHGFPREFSRYREQRQRKLGLVVEDEGEGREQSEAETALAGEEEAEEEESVLDGLVKTVLSQNTTDVNSQRAFASLKSAFPSWEDVLAAESTCIEDAIRCGGLAPTKAACIKNILTCLLEKRGKLCLEYLRDLSVGDIKAELSLFKGIGPKTVACVLMFHLQQDDFPVDTHVFEIAKTIGWIPTTADRNKAYLHLNQRIPSELKFDLNCLLFTHGKMCHRCGKRKDSQQCGKRKDSQHREESPGKACPLLNYCKNS
ncbi:putative DNA glycosylase At3g47830 [Syzygium oleosum]|uniref:putative DNA glycosylase At3g47830 n=1 Tax=Syzygium oleosum TaxID=219896 RepID=UPI0024B920CD|nr:putative DNA glycosylase At3g47830 [Syzygium oleosum]